jgi:hypothetical protein
MLAFNSLMIGNVINRNGELTLTAQAYTERKSTVERMVLNATGAPGLPWLRYTRMLTGPSTYILYLRNGRRMGRKAIVTKTSTKATVQSKFAGLLR